MLLYANMAIDAIQNAKNTFLDNSVKEESIKKPLKAFVESQRVFTKQMAKSFSDITTAYSSYDYASIFKPTK